MSDKDKKVNLREEAAKEMETLVEQHNELIKTIQEQQSRLSELKSMIIEKGGYMKALEDVEKQ